MENTNNANDNWQDKEDQWQLNASEENTHNLRDRDDEDEDEDNEEDEEETTKTDWGSVDPQEHPGLPSDMDPSGPGSAV